VEDAASSLGGQVCEGFGACRKAGLWIGAERIDGGVGVLACVDDVFERGIAGVVFSIGEEKDEVSGSGGD